MESNEASLLNPFEWALIGANSESLTSARDILDHKLSLAFGVPATYVNEAPVNMFTISPRIEKLAPYRRGLMVNEEWENFLKMGDNLAREPTMKHILRLGQPAILYEGCPFFNYYSEEDKNFLKNFSFGWSTSMFVDVCSDASRGQMNFIGLNLNLPASEAKNIHHFSNRLQLAYAYFCEGLAVNNLKQTDNTRPLLTPREYDCLAWLSTGLITKQIADKLNLSTSTVNEYIDSAKAKLGVKTRTQACARSLLLELISP